MSYGGAVWHDLWFRHGHADDDEVTDIVGNDSQAFRSIVVVVASVRRMCSSALLTRLLHIRSFDAGSVVVTASLHFSSCFTQVNVTDDRHESRIYH
ncbi:unnamed protein product [Heligmosomoides polygyrus]|uniref:Secreted protein n=1 Tax=Heligmosomoides polygyrus TaxID=6339 RepID=A0A183FH03_HELPZ|nr:unnamed protein product [Heligmosomoides polygyrus]